MSETAAEATQDGKTSGSTSAADEFKAPASQEELNRIIADRVKRVESKYADYNDVKAKAQQLDALSEASQSEQDKLLARISKLETDLSEKDLAAKRAEVAQEFGLTKEQAIALKYAPSEEAAREIAQGLASDTSTRKSQGNRVPAEGTNAANTGGDPLRALARDLFKP